MKYIAFFLITLSFSAFASKCPYYWGPDSKQINFDTPKDNITLLEASKLMADVNFRADLLEKDNDCGNITWFQASILNAQLKMYQVQKDTKYLDMFIELADKIANQNDIYTKKKDKLRKRIVFGWSSTKYTKRKKRHVMGVDSAIISEPFARFVNIVHENKLTIYKDKACDYLEIATRAMSEIEEDWNNKIGFYKFKRNSHKNLKVYPYNQGLAIGSVYIELYKAYDNINENKQSLFYYKRVNQIGTYFKRTLTLDRYFDRYLWRYSPKAYFEDSSHASIDINFVIKAYKNNLIFDELDMVRFSNTIFHNFKKDIFPRYIDGKQLYGYTSWHGLTCLKLVEIAKYSNIPEQIISSCLNVTNKIIKNKNILKDMPYQFYTQIIYGLPVIYEAKKNLESN